VSSEEAAESLAKRVTGLNLSELAALRDVAAYRGDDDDGPRLPPVHRRNGKLAGGEYGDGSGDGGRD
jgi:hypothetical protein